MVELKSTWHPSKIRRFALQCTLSTQGGQSSRCARSNSWSWYSSPFQSVHSPICLQTRWPHHAFICPKEGEFSIFWSIATTPKSIPALHSADFPGRKEISLMQLEIIRHKTITTECLGLPSSTRTKTTCYWRSCSDFPALNAITIADRLQLPHIQDYISFPHGKTFFNDWSSEYQLSNSSGSIRQSRDSYFHIIWSARISPYAIWTRNCCSNSPMFYQYGAAWLQAKRVIVVIFIE